MAVALNNQGATSFAAANWSDATGFANDATLIVANPGGPITAGLDQRATNIDYLDVLSAWNADIGSQVEPLRFEADNTGTGRFRYRPSGGRCWVEAIDASAASVIDRLDVGGSGQLYLVGGTFTTTTQDGGNIDAGAAICVTLYAFGGTSRWRSVATAITTAIVTAGVHTLERVGTTVTVTGGTVNLDVTGTGITTLNIYGGTVNILNGNIPTVNGFGGTINCTNARRPIALGATAFNQGHVKVLSDARTTISNVAAIGSLLAPQPL